MTKKPARWNDLTLEDFRTFTEHINNSNSALALCIEVAGEIQRVADALMCDPATDEHVHPGKPEWRRGAGTAKRFLEKKLQIVVSRALALGGILPDTLNRIVDETEAALRDRQRYPAREVKKIHDIVLSLAEVDPYFEDDDGNLTCGICFTTIPEHESLTSHPETCPWRKAVEVSEQGMKARLMTATPEGVANMQDDREARKLQRKAENLLKQAETRISGLERELSRQVEHSGRMERDSKTLRAALRIAMRFLIRGCSTSTSGDTIQAIGKVNEAYTTPRFYAPEYLKEEK